MIGFVLKGPSINYVAAKGEGGSQKPLIASKGGRVVVVKNPVSKFQKINDF